MKNKVSSISKKKKFENLDLIVFLGPFLVTFFTFTVAPVFISLFISPAMKEAS